MTVRRVYDGPSCRSVTKYSELNSVKRFVTVVVSTTVRAAVRREVQRVDLSTQILELKCFGTKTLDGPLCL